MKTSLCHLPERKREELKNIAEAIAQEINNCEMIILFGSYARGDYVEIDERVEYGVRTSFMSDYDILVLTSKEPSEYTERKLDKIDSRLYKSRRTPIQFINISVDEMNRCLAEGRYLYTDIKREGIMLYDSKKFKLGRRKKLNYDEIKEQAHGYFLEKYNRANSFLRSALHDYDDLDFVMATFHLHQACENYFLAIVLTHTLYTKKVHDLRKLLRRANKYSDKLEKLFPRDTEQEKNLFKLLRRAYVEARYNAKFEVTHDEIEFQLEKVQLFKNVTHDICMEQIEYYNSLSKKKKKNYDANILPSINVAETELRKENDRNE